MFTTRCRGYLLLLSLEQYCHREPHNLPLTHSTQNNYWLSEILYCAIKLISHHYHLNVNSRFNDQSRRSLVGVAECHLIEIRSFFPQIIKLYINVYFQKYSTSIFRIKYLPLIWHNMSPNTRRRSHVNKRFMKEYLLISSHRNICHSIAPSEALACCACIDTILCTYGLLCVVTSA